MDPKIILAPLTGRPADLATLNAAGELARGFDAHVDALFVRSDTRLITVYDSDWPSLDQIIAAADAEAAERAGKAKETFAKWRQTQDIAEGGPAAGAASAKLRELKGDEQIEIARAGRLADLIVLARPPADAPAMRALLEAALLESGRPVLMAPPELSREMLGTAVVAWNGSAEASRAVALSLPYLKRAKAVRVFAAAERNVEPAGAQRLSEYLAAHKIVAEVVSPRNGDRSVGAALLAEVAAAGAGLLVMGAYTHSRVRQIIFGGVTHHVLDHAEVPTLMVH